MPESRSTRAERGGVDCEQCHPILAVSDVREAVKFYTSALGFWLAFAEGDPPTFAGVNFGHVQLFLQQGAPAPGGCSVYFVVSDADKLCRLHESAGVAIIEPPTDRPYRLRDYTVQDRDGYRLTFGHRLPR
jgi:uncharacterized glyoxalase superfamily protein PhnB